jgi:hypothetical protein
MVLLTSVFLPPSHDDYYEHVDEIFAAVNTNVQNKFLSEVHILTESDCHEVLQLLRHRAMRMPVAHEILWKMELKLACKSTDDRKQPSYADFFRYANETLSDKVVLLSNADVVFDETLDVIDLRPILEREHGYVLSVRPPPHGGEYQRVFHRECDNTPRCTVGAWQGGGEWGQDYSGCSWDCYIFSPPLSSTMNLSHIDIVMNFNAAENVAGYQLEVGANISLYNPCYHVHAWHWHCLGGKMHSENVLDRADRPAWYLKMKGLPPKSEKDAVSDMFPCWNCPGIRMPSNAAGAGEYCQSGSMAGTESVTALKHNFRYPKISGGVCCNNSATCSALSVEQVGHLPHCQQAKDVDCVTWEFTGKKRYY